MDKEKAPFKDLQVLLDFKTRIHGNDHSSYQLRKLHEGLYEPIGRLMRKGLLVEVPHASSEREDFYADDDFLRWLKTYRLTEKGLELCDQLAEFYSKQ